MNVSSVSRQMKSILLLAGAFTFAFLMGEAVHELGHYLAHQAYGHAGIGIHLDPFGGSRIVGVTALPRSAMGITSAAGPLLNLVSGMVCTVLLWRQRHPTLLPAQLWGPVAMVQEGVTFSLGLLTPGGDAAWIIAWGVPSAVLLTMGMLLLLTGIAAMSWHLGPAVLTPHDPFWARIIIVLAGISLLMLVRAAHAYIVMPALVLENLIPLIFAIILSAAVAMLHRPLTNKGLRRGPESAPIVSWAMVISVIGVGVAMFALQIAI